MVFLQHSGWHGLSPLQWGRGCPCPRVRDVAFSSPSTRRSVTPQGRLNCPMTVVAALVPQVKWRQDCCLGRRHACFDNPSPTARLGRLVPKPFPSPALLREISRIINTSIFFTLCLLILLRPADEGSVYALGKSAINLLSCTIWVSVVPSVGTSKSIILESWSGDLCAERSRPLLYSFAEPGLF